MAQRRIPRGDPFCLPPSRQSLPQFALSEPGIAQVVENSHAARSALKSPFESGDGLLLVTLLVGLAGLVKVGGCPNRTH